MIFQMHPEHGRHIAYNHLEAKANEEAGWKTVTKDEFYDLSDKIEEEGKEEPKDDYESLVEQYEEKFGTRPHHKMKAETIKEKLAD